MTLIGLGLPIPALHRKELWGYERDYERHIYFPVDYKLDAFYKALEMSEHGDYYTDDIVAWLNEASKEPIKRRNFFILKKERPLFDEYKLPLEERIKIYHGLTTPPPTAQILEKARLRQARKLERAEKVASSNGEAAGKEVREGSREDRD